MCLRSEASRLTAAQRALALVVCRSYAVAMVVSEWGKNGEAVAAEMNEWFSDDVLVWQDTPRGETHAGTKTGVIMEETTETVTAKPKGTFHSVQCCE